MAVKTALSLNNLIQEIYALADGHVMLKSRFYGNFLNIYQSGKVDYSTLLMNVNNATIDANYYTMTLELMVMDKVFKDESNRPDVDSDTLQILGDVFSVISYSNRWQAFSKIFGASQMRKFVNKGEDQVTGWAMSIQLGLKRKNGICDLPVKNYDFEGEYTPFCAGVRIFEDDVLIEVVPSGGSFSYSTAGDPADLLINGVAIGTVPAGGSKDIPVVDSSTFLPVGSWNATEERWEVDSQVNTSNLYKTGADDASAPDGTDAKTKRGRGVDWFNLGYNNFYGHQKRFTGIGGGYWDEVAGSYKDVDGNVTTKALAFPDDIMLDFGQWERGVKVLGLYFNATSGASFTSARTGALALDVNGFTGWELMNNLEMQMMTDDKLVGGQKTMFDYPPVDYNVAGQPQRLWSGTETESARYDALIENGNIQGQTQTASLSWMAVREFLESEI